MAQMKPLIGKPQPGITAKSGNTNFFFQQDSTQLKRKWTNADDFWSSTRPSMSNEAPQWREFDSWQADKADKKSKD